MNCRAALRVNGELFWCDVEAPHPGMAHGNQEVDAYWCSEGEQKRYGKKREAPPAADG